MKIISIINEKGGTGKTTSTREITGVLKKNKKCLLIDCDYQANLTGSFGIEFDKTIYNVMIGENINNCILEIEKNVDIIPGIINSRDLERDLEWESEKETILKNKLEELEKKYDYILIDCRPDMRLLEKNALVCSDVVLTPIEPHNYSLDGFDILEELLKTINPILKNDIKHIGFFSRVAIGNAPKMVIENSDNVYENILDNYIRHSVKLQECSLVGKFIVDYAPRTNGALDYKNLVKELQNKNFI
ncbi:ParA family protein [Cetobacterium somerae]|uniref:ParA family protein n=1 Tax=Cetobacterium somerae TaxID=188913 RepID=UPI00211DE4C9|nr:ParA family protein [Cetobacterium somerae]